MAYILNGKEYTEPMMWDYLVARGQTISIHKTRKQYREDAIKSYEYWRSRGRPCKDVYHRGNTLYAVVFE